MSCWFCRKEPEESEEEMLFDTEFDTPVHESCIKAALADDPDHPEANLMTYLLDSINTGRYIYNCAKGLVDNEDSDQCVHRIRDLIWQPQYEGLEEVNDVHKLRTSPRLKPEICELCDGRGYIRKIRVCKGIYMFVCRLCHSGLRKRTKLNKLMDVTGHLNRVGWINTQQRIREIVSLTEEIMDDQE